MNINNAPFYYIVSSFLRSGNAFERNFLFVFLKDEYSKQ